MRFKGSLVKGLLIALSVALIPVTAVSAQKITPGSTCKVLNQKVVYLNKTYTCTKSGKKLLWNKGVAITPSPTPTPTPTPTPIILTWDNILQNYGEIATNVYEQSRRLMESPFQSKVKVNVFVGPNTKPINANPSEAYKLGSSLLRNFKQPDEVNTIYYSFLDKGWAKEKTQEVDTTSRWNYQFAYECTSQSACQGASAGMTQNWQAIGRFTSSNSSPVPMFSSGEVEIHEFTHSIYMFQMKPNFDRWYVSTPDWFSEGHASVIGKLGAAKSFSEFSVYRGETLRRNRPDLTLKDYSAPNILRFFDAFMIGTANQEIERYYLYTLGFSTIEALVAIGGIDSPMNLFLETAKGSTFEQAFKTIYGIEWKVAAPILAEVVSKQYKRYFP
jgi:hypothetical protein